MTGDGAQFTYELHDTAGDVRQHVRECEGEHVQQVCYSTYMDALTQVCFTERMIRSTVVWEGERSFSVEHAQPIEMVPEPTMTPYDAILASKRRSMPDGTPCWCDSVFGDGSIHHKACEVLREVTSHPAVVVE